jgi:hypothetical protein
MSRPGDGGADPVQARGGATEVQARGDGCACPVHSRGDGDLRRGRPVQARGRQSQPCAGRGRQAPAGGDGGGGQVQARGVKKTFPLFEGSF